MALDKVQRLIGQEERKLTSIQSIPSFHTPLENLIPELKSRSLTWQEIVAAQNEFEEIVESPLLDAFKHAETQRKLAVDALSKAAIIIPAQRQWPPCTVSISEEKLEFDQLESARIALIGKNTRAIWAVRQYGELAASYQTLAGKIERTSEWAAHEQKRIRDIEIQIERLNKRWQKEEQLNSHDPEIVEQIRRLRAQANISLERQKQSWLLTSADSPDAITYEGILQNLIEIVRMLRSTAIKMQDEGELS